MGHKAQWNDNQPIVVLIPSDHEGLNLILTVTKKMKTIDEIYDEIDVQEYAGRMIMSWGEGEYSFPPVKTKKLDLKIESRDQYRRIFAKNIHRALLKKEMGH